MTGPGVSRSRNSQPYHNSTEPISHYSQFGVSAPEIMARRAVEPLSKSLAPSVESHQPDSGGIAQGDSYRDIHGPTPHRQGPRPVSRAGSGDWATSVGIGIRAGSVSGSDTLGPLLQTLRDRVETAQRERDFYQESSGACERENAALKKRLALVLTDSEQRGQKETEEHQQEVQRLSTALATLSTQLQKQDAELERLRDMGGTRDTHFEEALSLAQNQVERERERATAAEADRERLSAALEAERLIVIELRETEERLRAEVTETEAAARRAVELQLATISQQPSGVPVASRPKEHRGRRVVRRTSGRRPVRNTATRTGTGTNTARGSSSSPSDRDVSSRLIASLKREYAVISDRYNSLLLSAKEDPLAFARDPLASGQLVELQQALADKQRQLTDLN
ncbi:hypothetical protein KIPB_003358 [Kipferlia bialata]|uniref:Uncharacterized protein n=1 Tax=Kipferlia bialata TaxID=797122 RepID=A0A9K3GHD5_9EUKA|nr:hypothetical protein KIPB_003358 [Kipferlia bialata]|eukprot:g3358.t1